MPSVNDEITDLYRKLDIMDQRLLDLEDPENDTSMTACAKGAVEISADMMDKILFLIDRVAELQTTVKLLWKRLKTLQP